MTVYLTPTDSGDAVELSTKTFRKKILPKGKIRYGDREINFDDEYLKDLAASYTDGAYDQVPYMLADASNAHTMDPERFRGECKTVTAEDDGLWGTFELSGEAADLVRANPKLGVSARIVEGYERSDGKTFKRALQHVLGTLDPRIPGMGAWEEVDLSNDGSYDSSEVIDLSNFDYEEEGIVSEEKKDVPVSDDAAFEAAKAMLPGWTDQEITDLLNEPITDEEKAAIDAEAAASVETEEVVEAEVETPEVEAKVVPVVEAEEANEEELVSLSNVVETNTAVDLANDDLRTQVTALQADVAKSRFAKERAEWISNGVPPQLIKQAEVLLTAPRGAVIDLSNGVDDNKVDAAQIVRTLLDGCAGYIELAKERGHTLTLSNEENDETAAREATISAWREIDKANNPHQH